MSSKADESSDRDYEVGYGRPPKATRFGVRAQPDRSKRQSSERKPLDVAALLDRSVSLSRNGKQTKMHAYEAMLHALAKQGLGGQIRALRQILEPFKEAGLLEDPDPRRGQHGGARGTSRASPRHLAVRLIRLAGPPPLGRRYCFETKLGAEVRGWTARASKGSWKRRRKNTVNSKYDGAYQAEGRVPPPEEYRNPEGQIGKLQGSSAGVGQPYQTHLQGCEYKIPRCY